MHSMVEGVGRELFACGIPLSSVLVTAPPPAGEELSGI